MTTDPREPREPGDAELDAMLASADRELLEVIKGSVDLEEGIGQVGDAYMRALYRQLSERELPGDPPFDVEASLSDLLGRVRAERAEGEEGA